uniref:Fibronectin type-III domain-containing protein n=1 Tax=Leptobrachium leishanense TaxID=445787 RepID=A0A8C5MGY1_9ANUR
MASVLNALYYLLLLVFSSALQTPSNVQLVSENFRHIMTWEENNTNASVFYNVTYTTYGKQIAVSECTNVTNQQCDLTGYFTDTFRQYTANVQSFTHDAVSNVSLSVHLRPIMNTLLGPPIVRVTAGPEFINITLNPPTSHLKSPDKKHNISMQDVYPILIYNIKLFQSNLIIKTLEEFVSLENENVSITNLQPHTTYCVSVTVSSSNNANRRGIPSALQCVTTQAITRNTGNRKTWIAMCIVGVFIVIFILTVLCGLDCMGFICIRKNLPSALILLPESASTCHKHTEFHNPEYLTPIKSISQEGASVHTEDHDECRPHYIQGTHLLIGQSDSSSTSNSTSLPPATSSSAESSGQEFGPLDENMMPEEPAPDMIMTMRNVPNICYQENALKNIKTILIQSNEATNINFNSVALGDPDAIWKSLKMVMSPVESQETMTTSHGPVTSPDISDTFFLDPGKNSPEEEELLDHSDYSDTEEAFASDYLKR